MSSSDVLAKQKKKKKKKSKSKSKDVEAPEVAPLEEVAAAIDTPAPAPVMDVSVDVDEKSSSKQSKKKKDKKSKKAKKRKRESEETAESAPIASDGEVEESEVTKQKKKKKKKKKDNFSTSSNVDSQAYYKEHEVTVSGTGSESLQVYRNFSDLPCDKKIYTHVTKDFKAPTPIQAASWPALFAGRDVIGIAETGSGKTLGFTLPALVHLSELPRLGKDVASRGPYMLCISPTRELAMQTHDVTTAIFRHANMRSICIYGGVDKYAQKDELRKGVHCIIATPGRLISLCREGAVSLGQVSYVVLDEADRMLDMGFEPDIRNLMGQVLPLAQRQTLLFSATWPEEVQALGGEFVNNPINIMIGTDELKASTSVTQVVEVMEDSYFDKNNRLVELLKANHKKKTERILIFVLYKKEVPRVERFLQQRGFSCVGISSDLGQHERVANINAFKDGSKPLLVATDVAARGLDIDNVEMVINYSFPLTVEDYVHRIGRTGRGGAKGHAHTFFTKFSKSLAGALVNVLNEAGAAVPDDLKAFGMVVKRKKGVYGDFSGRATNKPMAAPKRVKL